jgi:phosphoribosylanthranilate isomerase
MSGIKICGLFRACDIDYVNEAKPDYAGFILHFPKSHRNVEPVVAAEMRRRLQPGIRAVGVFVDQSEETVIASAERIGLDAVQLHGHEDDRYIKSLRSLLQRPVWKAFKVRSEADLMEAEKSSADEILLDNGYGTGNVFDWTILSAFSRPYILAGGLTPELITKVVMISEDGTFSKAAMNSKVGRIPLPKLFDISSGVETDKVKDRDKILAAVRAARLCR